VRPLLRELAAAVHDAVERGAIVRTQPGERHQVVRGHQNVDEIELQQAEGADECREMPRTGLLRARVAEPLRRERDPARRFDRQLHDILFSGSDSAEDEAAAGDGAFGLLELRDIHGFDLDTGGLEPFPRPRERLRVDEPFAHEQTIGRIRLRRVDVNH